MARHNLHSNSHQSFAKIWNIYERTFRYFVYSFFRITHKNPKKSIKFPMQSLIDKSSNKIIQYRKSLIYANLKYSNFPNKSLNDFLLSCSPLNNEWNKMNVVNQKGDFYIKIYCRMNDNPVWQKSLLWGCSQFMAQLNFLWWKKELKIQFQD